MEQTTEQRENATTKSSGIRYGLIGGLISVVFFVGLNFSGADMTASYWNWIGYAITGVLIFLAHGYYKQNGDGFMNYGEGIKIALWQGLISALIGSVFMFVFLSFVDDSMLQAIKDKAISDMETQGMSDEQIEQGMKVAGMFMSPVAMLVFGIIGGIIGSVILGLIVSIFTQNKRPEQSF